MPHRFMVHSEHVGSQEKAHMTDAIRTRDDLKRAINGAWDAYEAKLTELGKAIDPARGSSAAWRRLTRS